MQNIKLFALYLPQFHPTEENNKWWGHNYTDWEAVKELHHCTGIIINLENRIGITIMILEMKKL